MAIRAAAVFVVVPGARVTRARRRAVSDSLASGRPDSAAVVLGARVWPGYRFTRVVVALCLIALVIVGYFLLPNVFDVDQLIRE